MAYTHNGIEYDVVRSNNMFFEDMQLLRDRLTEQNETFTYIREGNTYRLIVPVWNKCFVYFGSRKRLSTYKNGTLKRYMTGLHLVSKVRKQVTEYIKENEVKVTDPDTELENPRQDFFNVESLAKCFCDTSFLVTYDVNRCYWNTAYNLGIIDKSLYDTGKSKKDYKEACNVSIGALAKRGWVQEFETGVMTEQYPTNSEPEYQYINITVRKKVEEFMDSFKMYNEAYAIFYVDCVFFNQNTDEFKEHNKVDPNFIEKHFKSYGYTCKKRYCQLVATNGQHIRIKWLDAENGKKMYSHYTLPITAQNRFLKCIEEINPELHKRIKANNKKSSITEILLTSIKGECLYGTEME